MHSHVEQFRHAIGNAGITPPEAIFADGAIHRFPTNGKPRDDSGWYVLHGDGVAAGAFGCWRQDLQSTWCAKSDSTMTEAERAGYQQRIQAMQAQREADKEQRQQSAMTVAGRLWNRAADCSSHPYLSAKGVQAHALKVNTVDGLIVPLRDVDGTLHSLQTITPDGSKLFMPGGRIKGCFHLIGEPCDVLIVAEGYATAATVHEDTGYAVAVAFNAGNLEAVAIALHGKDPALRIVFAVDDDWKTDGSNPGLTKATAAAQAVGGFLAVPVFPPGRGDKDTDFNDLCRLSGPEAVKACFAAVLKAPGDAIGAEWPQPTPLPNALPPVDPFDAELMPGALRPWVMDIAHRMQCPPDFPAVAALVAVSSLIGARAVVQPKARDDWQVVPNLWGATIGRPGVKKSPALNEALKPLNRLQVTEFETLQVAHDQWKVDSRIAEMQAEGNEKKAKSLANKDPNAARALLAPVDMPVEPLARRFIVNDATVEKLGELMQQNPWGTLSYRDELYGLLTSLDKQGQEGSRAFYLQSYDGNQGYTFDRIMRGTVHIPRVCLAMIGGIQPGRIQEYVRGAVAGGSADDGLLQRFGLTVWPDVDGDFIHVDQWPDTPAKQTAWAVFERLAALQPASDTDPVIWRFTPEAQALFVEWLVPFEIELRGDHLHPAMVSHLAKYRKLIPALALVFALIDTPDSGNLIHEGELIRALAWADYLRTHANRLYAAAVSPETTDAVTLLSKIKAGKLADRDGVILDSFTPRQVAQKCWAGLGTPDAVRKAAEVLADFDWVRRDPGQTGKLGGRPSDRYIINPAVLARSAG